MITIKGVNTDIEGIGARGGKELKAYVENGKKLSLKQAVLAKCYDCSAGYCDGAEDCEVTECPLYLYMPYGKAWKNREKKEMSPEQKEKLVKALQSGKINQK